MSSSKIPKISTRKNIIASKDIIFDSPTSGEFIELLNKNFNKCSVLITHGTIDTSCEFSSDLTLHFYSGITKISNPTTGLPEFIGNTLYINDVLPIVRKTICPYTNVSEIIVSDNSSGKNVPISASAIKHYVAEPGRKILNYNTQFDFNKIESIYTGWKFNNGNSTWFLNTDNGRIKTPLISIPYSLPEINKVYPLLYNQLVDRVGNIILNDIMIVEIGHINISISEGSIFLIQLEENNKVYYAFFKYLFQFNYNSKMYGVLKYYIPPDVVNFPISVRNSLTYFISTPKLVKSVTDFIKISKSAKQGLIQIYSEGESFFMGISNTQLNNIEYIFLSTKEYTELEYAITGIIPTTQFYTELEDIAYIKGLTINDYIQKLRKFPSDYNVETRSSKLSLKELLTTSTFGFANLPKKSDLYLFICSETIDKVNILPDTSTYTRILDYSRRQGGTSNITTSLVTDLEPINNRLEIILDRRDVLRNPDFKTELQKKKIKDSGLRHSRKRSRSRRKRSRSRRKRSRYRRKRSRSRRKR